PIFDLFLSNFIGNELTGNTNLITHYNLEHAYNKFCGKKVKEKLSNFLPELPGMIDCPGTQDGSSLRSLIEKPPVCGNSFSPLTGASLTGFRLHTGPITSWTTFKFRKDVCEKINSHLS
uniref:Mediator of RNA polymerase II transcription subunit 19 n=1 Tax=Hucho hucho TaxID=62062 RepID=A0A4W5N684_9TELE